MNICRYYYWCCYYLRDPHRGLASASEQSNHNQPHNPNALHSWLRSVIYFKWRGLGQSWTHSRIILGDPGEERFTSGKGGAGEHARGSAGPLLARPQATAVSGSAGAGSAKSRNSNFHTLCKRLIWEAFLFDIKQVRKKNLISSLVLGQTRTGIGWPPGLSSCVETSVGFLISLNGEHHIRLLKPHMPFGLNIKVPLRLSKY